MYKTFKVSDFTFGYEIELGDVSRKREIPPNLGKWEHAERDVINRRGEYKGIAGDPLGVDPPVGGEVNLMPTHTPDELTEKIMTLLDWFRQEGDDPTISCAAHGHVHVRIPGLRDDITALKRLTANIGYYQEEIIKKLGRFEDRPELKEGKGAKRYLKWDGGRPMPKWMACNIIEKAENFDDFIRIQCCGKDGESRGRPFRYAINTYCLKHTDTVEFRMFRGTMNPHEIWSTIDFAKQFIAYSINGANWSIDQLVAEKNYKFPEMTFDLEDWQGLQATKHPEGRGAKRRELIELL